MSSELPLIRSPLEKSAKKYTPNGGEKTPLIAPKRDRITDTVVAVPPAKNPSDNMPRVDSKRIIAKQFRPRKKISEFRRKGRDYSTWRGRIGVHLKVDEFDVKVLSEAVLQFLPGWSVEDHFDVMRLWQLEPPYEGQEFMELPLSEDEGQQQKDGRPLVDFDAARPEVFVFSFGAVVFWNAPSPQYEEEWMDKYLFCHLDACGVLHKPSAAENASDEMAFVYGEQSSFKWDVATLSTRESGEKLAISFALAKSSLLSIYEWRLQRTIDRNSHIPEELAKKGKIEMSREEISKEVGRIFLVKHGINLDASLIDTPEEFWEDDRFEGVYARCIQYFEISKRLELVNNRLTMIKDLHDVLIESAESKHAEYLEWIIIVLIIAEVVLDLLHLGFY